MVIMCEELLSCSESLCNSIWISEAVLSISVGFPKFLLVHIYWNGPGLSVFEQGYDPSLLFILD